MSERLTDAELEVMRDHLSRRAVIAGSFADFTSRLFEEVVARRAADTKPPPSEQGTLRDGIAMDALREMWRHPAPGVGLTIAGLHGRDHAADACAAYAIADAMLGARVAAKETEKP